MNNKTIDISIVYIYGFGWLIGGLVYFLAGILDPIAFSSTTQYSTELAAQQISSTGNYWYLYVICFAIFSIADSAVLLTGLVIRNLLGPSPKTNIITLLIFSAGFLSLITDLSFFTNWLMFGTFVPNFDVGLKANFWTVSLMIQNIGFWLSAWGFLLATIFFYMIYGLLKEQGTFTNTLKWTTLTLSCLSLLMVITMCIYVVNSSIEMVTGVIFMIFTVFAIPAWTISLGSAIRKQN